MPSATSDEPRRARREAHQHDWRRSQLVFQFVNTNTLGGCLWLGQVNWVWGLVAWGGPLGAHHDLHARHLKPAIW